MKYGIEFEFFVKHEDTDEIVPAYKATTNLDGCPIIGELKTDIHPTLVEAVFELKKLIFLEKMKLVKKGYKMAIMPMVKLDKDLIVALRRDARYIDRKSLDVLDEKSIYGKGTGKVLPKGVYKASLQINMSSNPNFAYPKYHKIEIGDKEKWEYNTVHKLYSELFDFITPILKLDNEFKKEIQDTNRVKGVYAIKEGDYGKRIEYRSLPNIIDLDKLCRIEISHEENNIITTVSL